MANTDRLTDLQIKRDAIEANLGTGKDYVELQMSDGRRVRQQVSVQVLQYLNDQIERMQRIADNRKGPARNRARLTK